MPILAFSMGEALDTGDAALEARFEGVVEQVMSFRPREPHHHPDLLGGEATIPYERIFRGLARGREAIDLAIGEGLCSLEDRDQLMDLGYSRMIDYAREALGLPESTARDKARLVREMRTRPCLREAVRSGRVSPRHAREIYPVARGDAERRWVELAATLSVRELHRVVKRALAAAGGPAPADSPAAAEDGERWNVASLPVRPEHRIVVEEALRLAEEALWRGAPRWRQVEALCAEFLGWHAGRLGERDLEEPAPAEGSIPPEDLEWALEIESNGWDWLEAVPPLSAPALPEMEPRALDARLRDLVRKRKSWDELFGILGKGFVDKRMATSLGFASLGQYLKECLGMSRRAVEQRVWLEKRMEALPQLRHALANGEVCYEKARLIAGVADWDSVNAWIRRARGMTCIELARALSGAEDAQACAREKVDFRMPRGVARLLEVALRCAERVFGTPDRGECLVLVAVHFVTTWWSLLERRSTLSRRVQERDRRWCTVPGCSRASGQGHHLVHRSQGGGNDSTNLTALCAPHHLRGIHGGRLRVSGTAPDHLVWELADGTPFGPRGPFVSRAGEAVRPGR